MIGGAGTCSHPMNYVWLVYTMAYSRRYRDHRRRTHRRRRDSRKCPKGQSRRILGQKRRMVNGISRIVRHGRLSKRCYRR